MSNAVLANGTILIDDRLRDDAQSVTDGMHDRVVSGLKLILEDGTEVELPSPLALFFGNVLNGIAQGPVSIRTFPDELTTTTAAEILGVTRPTLMKWIDAGLLPSHKVRSHTRLSPRDVFAFGKELSARRETSFAALRAWDEAFEMSGGQ